MIHTERRDMMQIITSARMCHEDGQGRLACTSWGPASFRKVAFVCAAHALASRVLPVPGGPYSSTPFGGLIPRDLKRSCSQPTKKSEQCQCCDTNRGMPACRAEP